MQIRNLYPAGNTTCAVVNGSPIVTAAAGSDWSQAVVGGFFSIDDPTGAPIYDVAAVRAPGLNVSNRWELTLRGNYLEGSNAAAAYLIHKDFFANGTPMWNKGDTQFFPIQNRANAKLDALITKVAKTNPPYSNAQSSPTDGKFQLLNPDQNLFFSLQVRGAAGDETLEVVTTGEVAADSGIFENSRPSPSDGTFQVFNPDQNKYFTIRVRGAAGHEVPEIVTPGEAP